VKKLDSITHTLLGLTAYGATKKEGKDKSTKKALLFSAIVSANIPDIDLVARLTETGRVMDLMWHRGITHSIIMIPLWAVIIYYLSYLLFKSKDHAIFYIALFSVFIHVLTDSLNTWGTGLLEPFSPIRVSFGTLSIVDFAIWGFMLTGLTFTFIKRYIPNYKIYRFVWLFIGVHLLIQGAQSFYYYNHNVSEYEKVAIRPEFIPWHYTVIGKDGANVDVYTISIFREKELIASLNSAENADLTLLHQRNPKAAVLMQWAPFVVIVDNEEEVGVYDPRFYMNGSSFLYEYVKKKEK
jgi:inner membrane protein